MPQPCDAACLAAVLPAPCRCRGNGPLGPNGSRKGLRTASFYQVLSHFKQPAGVVHVLREQHMDRASRTTTQAQDDEHTCMYMLAMCRRNKWLVRAKSRLEGQRAVARYGSAHLHATSESYRGRGGSNESAIERPERRTGEGA